MLVTLAVVLVALVVVGGTQVPWRVLGAGAPAVRSAPATDFTAAQLATDTAFHASLRPWTYTGLVVALVAAVLLGLTPVGARIVRRVARPLGGSWPVQVVLGTAVITAIPQLVVLPLAVQAERVLRRYGISTQQWGGWSLDLLRGWAVSAVVTALLLLVLIGLARQWPRHWWAPGALIAAGAVVLGSVLYPVVVEPLSNTFTPMPPGPQRTALLAMAHRDGVDVTQVLVADASRRTTAENAYVSGLGSTRRIVVYDTLLEGATPREVTLVVAHELGHAKAHDVRLGTGLGALSAAAAVIALAWLLDPRGRAWRLLRSCGARGPHDPGVLALVVALVAVASLAVAPASNVVSRRVEARADVHSLQLTRDVQGFAMMQRRLAVTNITDLQPRWWRTQFFATHPSPPWRVAMARAWAVQHGLPGPTPVDSGS